MRALEAELAESRETLAAIRRGDIDAIIVGNGDGAPRVYTLETADRPYRHLIEQMQEGALTLGEDGTVLYCNRRVGELVGLPQEQVLGQDFALFVAPADTTSLRVLLGMARLGSGRSELTLRRTDGVEVPVVASLSALHGGEGVLLCGVLTDLTEHHARLLEASATNARLRAEIAGREQAEEALRQAQKMQAIGQLTGGIAHDFNNMLQGVASGTELMRRRLAQTSRPRRCATSTRAQGHRARLRADPAAARFLAPPDPVGPAGGPRPALVGAAQLIRQTWARKSRCAWNWASTAGA